MFILLSLLVVLLICIIIGIMAARRPILFKMGLRNLVRRRSQTVIVIIGLLVGTAIVSSSLVIGDSLEYIFVKDTIERLDAIDELVYNETSGQGISLGFEFQMFEELKESLEANNTPIDGVAPLLLKIISIKNIEEDLGEGGIQLIGFNASYEDGFGSFRNLDGQVVDDQLEDNELIINARAAEKVDAKEGENLTIISVSPYFVRQGKVKHIVENEGKGNWQKDANIFMNLNKMQQWFYESDNISHIKISNTGGIESGVELSEEVTEDVRAIIKANGWPLEIDERKKENIETAKEFSENVTEIFMVLGSFSIIAGVLLIINIFVMLAEERKSEMGISRAVGMKRGHLMQTYMFEGLFYAILAAILGTIFGLVLGYIIILSFGVIFADIAAGITLSFSYKPISLALAFCLGLIITFITIAIASWNVSKLNIVRAIRKIPEPVKEKATTKMMLLGLFFILAGIAAWLYGASLGTKINTGVIAGPALIVLGITFLLNRILNSRAAFTLGGIFIIIAVLFPRGVEKGNPSDIQMFIVIGVLLVLGAILIVMFNSDYILKPFLLLGHKNRAKPVLKIATSYPMRKKFRTGMTMAIFALIIFTVTVISMMSHLQEGSVLEEIERQTGGFDIIARTTHSDQLNITEEIENSTTLRSEDFEFHSWSSVIRVRVARPDAAELVNYSLWGLSEEMIDHNKYTFQQKAVNYTDANGEKQTIETDRDVWDAIKQNTSLAVVDGSARMLYAYEALGPLLKLNVGDTIEVSDVLGQEANITIIGIMDQVMFYTWGIFVSNELIEDNFPVTQIRGYSYFFELREGADGFEISQGIERTLFDYNVDAVYLPGEVKTFLDIQRSVMLLLQAYLGLGLLVGIAALGVITARAVVERKQEIGTLRAIGFKSRMISRAFLLEISFVALLGIVIGVALGLALSYDMYLTYYSDRVAFSIPWLNIFVISLIAYIATLITTSSPARRAAKIPPAEAVRYIE